MAASLVLDQRPRIEPAGDRPAEADRLVEAELHVDIGEAEIGVDQEHATPQMGERMGQRDREEGLADPALPEASTVRPVMPSLLDERGGAMQEQPREVGGRERFRARRRRAMPAPAQASPASATERRRPSRRTVSSRAMRWRVAPSARQASA
ncbi:MAG: hypothetical protein R3D25_04865 [Geminicoccaceae bacterium]